MHVNEHGFTICVLQDLYLTHTKVNVFILLFTCQWLCDDKTLASALKKKKKILLSKWPSPSAPTERDPPFRFLTMKGIKGASKGVGHHLTMYHSLYVAHCATLFKTGTLKYIYRSTKSQSDYNLQGSDACG